MVIAAALAIEQLAMTMPLVLAVLLLAALLTVAVAANVGAVADLSDRRPAPRRLAGEVR